MDWREIRAEFDKLAVFNLEANCQEWFTPDGKRESLPEWRIRAPRNKPEAQRLKELIATAGRCCLDELNMQMTDIDPSFAWFERLRLEFEPAYQPGLYGEGCDGNVVKHVMRSGTIPDVAKWSATLCLTLEADAPNKAKQHEAPNAAPAGGEFLSCPDLAKKHKISEGALRKRLHEWRSRNAEGWIEVQNPTLHSSKFMYCEATILHVIDGIKRRAGATDEMRQRDALNAEVRTRARKPRPLPNLSG